MGQQKKELRLTDEEMVALIHNEAQILGMLDHPHVVSYVDSFLVGHNYFIFMELVEGQSLLELVPKGGMSEKRGRCMFRQIVSALAYCHSRNVCFLFFLFSFYCVFFFFFSLFLCLYLF